jgi:hypothetical protein
MPKSTKYEYGRIAVLEEQLVNAGIAPQVIAQVMEGGESILKTTTSAKKATWMKGAMQRMDQLLDRSTRYAIREACACCLGGKRQEDSRGIAKKFATLEERIQAANEARFVFGHSVSQQEDGSVLVMFSPEGDEHYRCVCLPKAEGGLPITYCYCCGGHVKHHLQNALGRKLSLKVRSSALSSAGSKPCTFLFTIEEELQAVE